MFHPLPLKMYGKLNIVFQKLDISLKKWYVRKIDSNKECEKNEVNSTFF